MERTHNSYTGTSYHGSILGVAARDGRITLSSVSLGEASVQPNLVNWWKRQHPEGTSYHYRAGPPVQSSIDLTVTGNTSRVAGAVVVRTPDGRRWHLLLPLGYPAVLFAAGPLTFGLCRLWRLRREARRLRAGACPGCGYDLRANSGRCPECGGEGSSPPARATRFTPYTLGTCVGVFLAFFAVLAAPTASTGVMDGRIPLVSRQEAIGSAAPNIPKSLPPKAQEADPPQSPRHYPEWIRAAANRVDPSKTYVFLSDGSVDESIRQQIVSVDVYVRRNGRWTRRIFTCQPGEVIGDSMFPTTLTLGGPRRAGADLLVPLLVPGAQPEVRSQAVDAEDPIHRLLALLASYAGIEMERDLFPPRQ